MFNSNIMIKFFFDNFGSVKTGYRSYDAVNEQLPLLLFFNLFMLIIIAASMDETSLQRATSDIIQISRTEDITYKQEVLPRNNFTMEDFISRQHSSYKVPPTTRKSIGGM